MNGVVMLRVIVFTPRLANERIQPLPSILGFGYPPCAPPDCGRSNSYAICPVDYTGAAKPRAILACQADLNGGGDSNGWPIPDYQARIRSADGYRRT